MLRLPSSGFRSLAAAYPIVFRAAAQSRASCRRKAGRFEDAEKTLRSAVERNGNNAHGVQSARHRVSQARPLQGSRRGLPAAPCRSIRTTRSRYLNLGVLCDLYLQQPERALEAYERYLALAATPDEKVNGWVTELKKRLGQRAARRRGPNDVQSDQECIAVLLLATAPAFAAEPAAEPQAHCRQRAAQRAGEHRAHAGCAVEQRLPSRIAAQSTRRTPAAAPGRRAQNDRLDLDTTIVTGNRELPKVLYIVPWKKADLGDLPAQPFNTLLDEVLTPVDRDVFRREVTYYGACLGCRR